MEQPARIDIEDVVFGLAEISKDSVGCGALKSMYVAGCVLFKMFGLKRRHLGFDVSVILQGDSALAASEALLAAGLPAPIFLAADHRLLNAARAEGLVIDNPNAHP